MSRPLVAFLFAAAATAIEIGLAVFGHLQLLELIAVGLALFATELLVISWHPLALVASASVYLTAVAIGILDFSLLGFLLTMV
jgi:hypothetical protein